MTSVKLTSWGYGKSFSPPLPQHTRWQNERVNYLQSCSNYLIMSHTWYWAKVSQKSIITLDDIFMVIKYCFESVRYYRNWKIRLLLLYLTSYKATISVFQTQLSLLGTFKFYRFSTGQASSPSSFKCALLVWTFFSPSPKWIWESGEGDYGE